MPTTVSFNFITSEHLFKIQRGQGEEEGMKYSWPLHLDHVLPFFDIDTYHISRLASLELMRLLAEKTT